MTGRRTDDVVSTRWTPEHLAELAPGWRNRLTVLPPGELPRMLPDVDFWDLWPVRDEAGGLAALCGGPVWAGLSAPATGHPGERHDSARIRLVQQRPAGWADLGLLFPVGASSGSREWAGSLVYDSTSRRLSAYYTAAGERDESTPSYRQRIMAAEANVRCNGKTPELTGWSKHREVMVADEVRYAPATEISGQAGFIKAFRDPSWFSDPATGARYLLFTGSVAEAATSFNGCAGLARATDGGWELLDPLLTADGVNNELERPHIVIWGDRYYLFFSTQARTFHPGVAGPTGLYGFVADRLMGPYEPLNGSGLVLQNPPAEPFQAYSWLVLNDLSTVAFVDSYGLRGSHPDELEPLGAAAVRSHFGGTMAPVVRLGLAGATGWIEQEDVGLPLP